MASIEIDPELLAEEVIGGSRPALARAITLVESVRPDHHALADQLLELLPPEDLGSVRVAVSGVPGAGKSTLIEALGSRLTDDGHRVAVLAVDPSSTITGGSILGDRTRMAKLASDGSAFVRPSPTSGALGGVGRSTRASIALVEAAGYDTVLIETVGVGQSEMDVADMVDCYCLTLLAGAGDELQAIKRGTLEHADIVVINKADGDGLAASRVAARQLASVLRQATPTAPGWRTPVLLTSATEGSGITEWWQAIEEHRVVLSGSGELLRRRRAQRVQWTRALVREQLLATLRADPRTGEITAGLEGEVAVGAISPARAAAEIIAAFGAAPGR